MSYQGRVHLDRRHPADRQAPLEDEDPGRRQPSCRIWGFDGSSTNQAEGHASDRVLKPVFTCPDPIRGGDHMLVLCEVLNTDMTPHPSNTRAAAASGRRAVRRPGADLRHRAGVHLLQGRPPARLPRGGGFPAPQGGYYCGVGADEIFGREIVEKHLDHCLAAGLGHLRHQRRGHARPVGVPGRPAGPAGGLGPPVGRPLAALPHRRGLRRLRDAGPQAGQGRLERRGRAHQLLHQGDARGLRRDHHRLRGAGPGRQAAGARQATTAPASRTA